MSHVYCREEKLVEGRQAFRENTVVAAGAPGQPGVDHNDWVAFPERRFELLLGVRDGELEGVEDGEMAPPMQLH